MLKLAFFFVILTAQACRAKPYVPPAPWIQALSPVGIRLSIPDETGIKLVAFHVKINEEFVGLEQGTIARDIVNTTKGEWAYQDKSTKLQKGDTIYYWIHVIYNNLGYNLIEQKYIVEDFYDNNGNKIQSCKNYCDYYIKTARKKTNVNNCHTQCYVPQMPLIEPFTPAGIRMSISDEPGISLVAFHVKINDKFVGLEAGTIARDIVKVKNRRWTYYDTNTKLKKGDTIYYWMYVIYKGLGYSLVEQEYEVTDFFDENGKTKTESNNGNSTTPSSNEISTTPLSNKVSTIQSSVQNTTTESSAEEETATEYNIDIRTTKSAVEKTTTKSSNEKKSKQSSSTGKSSTNNGKN